jgi:hypothetical protein
MGSNLNLLWSANSHDYYIRNSCHNAITEGNSGLLDLFYLLALAMIYQPGSDRVLANSRVGEVRRVCANSTSIRVLFEPTFTLLALV